jgi:hypothetical protein
LRGLLSFPPALELLMCGFGKWDGWMGFVGPDALVAVEFLARLNVTFRRLAPAGPTDLYSLSMEVDVKIDGIGQRAVRLCFGSSCTLARLIHLSP